MNATLLKRLIKAIKLNDSQSLSQIANSIIEAERKKGHEKLADQLEELVNKTSEHSKSPNLINSAPRFHDERNLTVLPTSRRDNQPLATVLSHNILQHHMVLPPDVEERFVRVEKEYSARERLAKYNLKPRRKILLYGPPGCGKTLGAERLAWNTGLPLVKVRFDTIISSFFGESATNLRTVFEASREKPCLLLLDECDYIAKSRVVGQDVGEVPRIVNMLLMLLDEYNSEGLLVATTNLETTLDKAIFRRFDDIIEIPRPGALQIRELLRMTFSACEISEEIKWDKIVEKMNGFSAASVVAAAQNALKSRILEGSSSLMQNHLDKAICEVNIY